MSATHKHRPFSSSPTKNNKHIKAGVVVFDYPRYVWNRFSRARSIVGRATNCITCPDQRVMTNKKRRLDPGCSVSGGLGWAVLGIGWLKCWASEMSVLGLGVGIVKKKKSKHPGGVDIFWGGRSTESTAPNAMAVSVSLQVVCPVASCQCLPATFPLPACSQE
jgi:hypothetical protein